MHFAVYIDPLFKLESSLYVRSFHIILSFSLCLPNSFFYRST
jgi:hypothetical protein